MNQNGDYMWSCLSTFWFSHYSKPSEGIPALHHYGLSTWHSVGAQQLLNDGWLDQAIEFSVSTTYKIPLQATEDGKDQ